MSIYILWSLQFYMHSIIFSLRDQTHLYGKVVFNENKSLGPRFLFFLYVNTQRFFLKKSTYQNKAIFYSSEVERLQNDYNIVIQHKEVGRNVEDGNAEVLPIHPSVWIRNSLNSWTAFITPKWYILFKKKKSNILIVSVALNRPLVQGPRSTLR